MSLTRIILLLALGIAYFVAASATLATTRFHSGLAVIWIATAVLLAGLLTRPQREWPAALVVAGIASCIATGLWGFGWAAAVPMAILNCAEAWLAAWLIRRQQGRQSPFATFRGIVVFILAAGCIAPSLLALPGAAIAALHGLDFADNWIRWTVGHGLGAITFAPVMILLAQGITGGRTAKILPSSFASGALALLLVAGTTFAVFAQSILPLLFLPTFPAIIATFRLGQFGAAASLAIIATVGGIITVGGTGPVALIAAPFEFQLQFFQFYLAITALVVLPIAAELAQRKALFAQLLDSEARYKLVVDRSSDVVMSLDIAGVIQFVSPSIASVGGYSPATLIGENARTLVHPDDRDRVRQAHVAALTDPSRTHIIDYRGLTADGAPIWFETHTQAVLDDRGEPSGVVSAIRDISHRKAIEAGLLRDAETDALTGLLNRRGYLNAVARQAGASGKSGHCVATFDIDFFKLVNDTHGHAAGDLALQTFARIAASGVREGDLVGRLGGEEFAIFLEGATMVQAWAICERIREHVADMAIITATQSSIAITVSCGLAPFGAAQPDLAAALASADTALYQAKSRGRNRLERAA